MNKHAPIFLWGFMGSGKSRLGKRLAPKLNRSFIDLDDYIEDKTSLTVSEIFNQLGETRFRKVEEESITELLKEQDVIVACGGGTPCFGNSKSKMNAVGLTIYLDVEHETLVQRLWKNRSTRPLIEAMKDKCELSSFIKLKLAERMPYYAQAQFRMNNTYPKGSIDELITTIELLLD